MYRRTIASMLAMALALVLGAAAPAYAQTVVATIPVGAGPSSVAVNARTNRIYVTNGNDYVSVIDGATNAVVTTLAVGDVAGVAVNE